jgi:hypothetical protein
MRKVSSINYHTSIYLLNFESKWGGAVENGISNEVLNISIPIVIHNFIEQE